MRNKFLFCLVVMSVFLTCALGMKAVNAEGTQKLYIGEKTPNLEMRNLFLEMHPNVEFVDVEIDWAIEDPIERIGGYENFDILHITTDEGIAKLIRYGCIEPLTSLEIISEYETYFPQAKEMLASEGKVIGVPVRMDIRPWMINQRLWDEYQLPSVPITFDEYIDLVELWHCDYASMHRDSVMAGDPGWGGTRMTILLNLIEQYVYEQQQSDSLLGFENDEMYRLMERIETLEEFSYPRPFQGPLLQGRYDSDFWFMDIMQTSKKEDFLPILPPVVMEGSTPRIGGELSLLCLLQQSENKELAMEYLSFVAMNKDQYQPGLSQMLLSLEYSGKSAADFPPEAIELWNSFLPYITFYTDALGGLTYAREHEDVTSLVDTLRHSWDQEEVREYEVDSLVQALDRTAKRYYDLKH